MKYINRNIGSFFLIFTLILTLSLIVGCNSNTSGEKKEYTVSEINDTDALTFHFVKIEGLIEQKVAKIVVEDIFHKAGIDVTINPYPATRALELSSSGQKDGEILRIFNFGEVNPTLLRVPTPYYYVESMGFIRKNSGVIVTSKEDLKNYTVGIRRGVRISLDMTEGVQTLEEVDSTEQLMEMLISSRVDIILTNTIDGKIVLEKMGLSDEIETLAKPISVQDLFIYVNEKNEELIPTLDNVIHSLKESGELETNIKVAEEIITKKMISE